jgi:tetratricopeptide (TPR) repeat protein
MKLIRWLLSNIILIAFVLALSYAYVYWDNLTGEDTPAGKAIAWVSEEFEEVEGLLAFLKLPENEPQVTEQITETEITEQVVVVTQAEPVVEQGSDLQPPAEDRYVTVEIEQSLSRVSDDGAATGTAEAETQSTRELWINARRSFHRRDFESSINSYEQLISKTQDNFDAYGELGNVYFNQGKMKQAAGSYYEAAVILVRLGQLQRANSLVGMLGSMDQEKAKELQALITSARS